MVIVCLFFILAVISEAIFIPAAKRWETQRVDEKDYRGVPLEGTFVHPYYDIQRVPDGGGVRGWLDISLIGLRSIASDVDDQPMEEIHLPWNFTFYGNLYDRVWINANGFVSFVNRVCQMFCGWANPDIYYIRYIAGILTDLNPPDETTASVKYLFDQDTRGVKRLIVQWTNVPFWRYNNREIDPRFTFQVHLYQDGGISINYKSVPIDPARYNVDLPDGTPDESRYYVVRYGLSDAIIYRNESILTYHQWIPRYEDLMRDLTPTNAASIQLTPLPTCTQQPNCNSCLVLTDMQRDHPGRLQCGWCQDAGVCTDTLGRELENDTVAFYCSRRENLLSYPRSCPVTSDSRGTEPCDASLNCMDCLLSSSQGYESASPLSCLYCQGAKAGCGVDSYEKSQQCYNMHLSPIRDIELCKDYHVISSAPFNVTDPLYEISEAVIVISLSTSMSEQEIAAKAVHHIHSALGIPMYEIAMLQVDYLGKNHSLESKMTLSGFNRDQVTNTNPDFNPDPDHINPDHTNPDPDHINPDHTNPDENSRKINFQNVEHSSSHSNLKSNKLISHPPSVVPFVATTPADHYRLLIGFLKSTTRKDNRASFATAIESLATRHGPFASPLHILSYSLTWSLDVSHPSVNYSLINCKDGSYRLPPMNCQSNAAFALFNCPFNLSLFLVLFSLLLLRR